MTRVETKQLVTEVIMPSNVARAEREREEEPRNTHLSVDTRLAVPRVLLEL
jgi:hypothetical protein